jgi:Fic family protein
MKLASPKFWITLGECHSKCEHLAGVPLSPEIDQYLHQIYLAKGVAATTAIEGNTLSENQVLEHLEGKLKVAPSQEYLKQEIDNIVNGCNMILGEIKRGVDPPLTTDRIKELNRIVLSELDPRDAEAIPGEIRKRSVGVGKYRGAPAEDCEYLLDRLCQWLNGTAFKGEPGTEVRFAILKAILAHLYIAWVHPFGDGNGRTARLVEVQILLASGVPSPAAQLLSNHYNNTRTEYYRHLDVAREDALCFIAYAVQGLCDGLREQIEAIRIEQWEIGWVNYVHSVFDGLRGSPHDRRKHLALDLSNAPEPVTFAKLREISPRVAMEYKDRTYRTLLRDVKVLIQMGLIISTDDKRWRARKERILSFLPIRALKATDKPDA